MKQYFIYSLWYKDRCFYVGASANPANRLYQHLAPRSSKMGLFIQSIDCDDVYLKIHERITTKNAVNSYTISSSERTWIWKMQDEGHALFNTAYNTKKWWAIKKAMKEIEEEDNALNNL